MKHLIIFCLALAACGPSTEDRAKRLMPSSATCVTERGESTSVSFCTDGKTLAICADDGCITVNLPAERP